MRKCEKKREKWVRVRRRASERRPEPREVQIRLRKPRRTAVLGVLEFQEIQNSGNAAFPSKPFIPLILEFLETNAYPRCHSAQTWTWRKSLKTTKSVFRTRWTLFWSCLFFAVITVSSGKFPVLRKAVSYRRDLFSGKKITAPVRLWGLKFKIVSSIMVIRFLDRFLNPISVATLPRITYINYVYILFAIARFHTRNMFWR